MKPTIASAAQFSTHFKSLRKAKGWSQSYLGQKLGIGQARVAQIENDPGSISVDKLLQILHVLDAKLVLDAEIGSSAQQHSTLHDASETLAQTVLKTERRKATSPKPVASNDSKAQAHSFSKAANSTARSKSHSASVSTVLKPAKAKQSLLRSMKDSNTSSRHSDTKKKW